MLRNVRNAGNTMAVFWLLATLAATTACSRGAGDSAADAPAPLSSSTSQGLEFGHPVEHLDTTAREPMIVEHPDGSLFVAGYGRENPLVAQTPALWKSVDGGGNWQRVDVGTVAAGAIGNSDVDLAVGPDGTLYFATMGFDRTDSVGVHVAMGVSNDAGATWTWTMLSRAHAVDRPWVVAAPDGTAHVIWNDDDGIGYAASEDGGMTWDERPRIAAGGGSSHLAVGPNGELAVRATPLAAGATRLDEDVDWIVVSTDGGRSWARHEPPGMRDFALNLGGVPRWIEPLAWDTAGVLYSLWSENTAMWLAASSDQGATWTSWQVAASDDTMYYPYLIARGPGELAATWFSGEGESLAVQVARIDIDSGEPRTRRAPPTQIDVWVTSTVPQVREPGGEYLPVVFLSGGGLAIVSPIQDDVAERFGFTWSTISGDVR